jgi:hypothetical protein
MIDPTEMEIAAMRSCLSPLGEYVGEIGMTRLWRITAARKS